MYAKKRNHIVLVDAIPRNANPANQYVAPEYGHTAGKDLDAIGENAFRVDCSEGITGSETRVTDTVLRNFGRCTQYKCNVVDDRVVGQIQLQTTTENTPLPFRFTQRPWWPITWTIRVVRARQIAT